jgi:hypothetical protein
VNPNPSPPCPPGDRLRRDGAAAFESRVWRAGASHPRRSLRTRPHPSARPPRQRRGGPGGRCPRSRRGPRSRGAGPDPRLWATVGRHAPRLSTRTERLPGIGCSGRTCRPVRRARERRPRGGARRRFFQPSSARTRRPIRRPSRPAEGRATRHDPALRVRPMSAGPAVQATGAFPRSGLFSPSLVPISDAPRLHPQHPDVPCARSIHAGPSSRHAW